MQSSEITDRRTDLFPLSPPWWKQKSLWKENLALWFFSFRHLKHLFFLRPVIVFGTPTSSVVRIRLNRRTRNHVGSLYFGAICAGVDACGGFLAFRIIRSLKRAVGLVFKDVHGEFLKRATNDVYFLCEDGSLIKSMVEETNSTGQRVSRPITIDAYIFENGRPEKVAHFTTTLSLKKQLSK